MGILDKVNNAAEDFGKNSELLATIGALMTCLGEQDASAREFCVKLQKMANSFESDKKGVVGLAQKVKGTLSYGNAANEVRSESTRLLVNEVLRNHYAANESFNVNEWKTISDMDFAGRVQSKIMTYYMQTKGDAFEEATSNDKVFQAMGERLTLGHMKKRMDFKEDNLC